MSNSINSKYGKSAEINRGLRNSISDRALLILALVIWTSRILISYIQAAVMRVPYIGVFTDEVSFFLYVILILLALPSIIKKVRLPDLCFTGIVVLICLINFGVFPENEAVLMEKLPTFLFSVFPLYFIGLSVDYKKMYPWLLYASIVTIFANTFYRLFIAAPMDEIASLYEGDMWGAYNLLPHVCIVALSAINQPKIVRIFASILGFVVLSSLGSRGPIIALAIVLLLYSFCFKKYKRPVVSRGIIIVTVFIAFILLDEIMLILYEFAKNAGLSIRVFDKFLSGSITDSSSRDLIQMNLLEFIKDKPLLGYGIYSDRVLVGTYAHSFVVELWVSFGIFIGTGLFLSLIVMLVNTIKRLPKNSSYIVLFLSLGSAGFIKLFMSGSYMDEMYLFMLIGYCINIARSYHLGISIE